MSSLSASMSGLSVSENSKTLKTPPRSQRKRPIPNAPERNPERKRKAIKLDSGSEERIYMANKRYRDGMGEASGTLMEAGRTKRRRRSKRRKSRRKRKTKRKKKRKSRKRRKTRRRRRKKRRR